MDTSFPSMPLHNGGPIEILGSPASSVEFTLTGPVNAFHRRKKNGQFRKRGRVVARDTRLDAKPSSSQKRCTTREQAETRAYVSGVRLAHNSEREASYDARQARRDAAERIELDLPTRVKDLCASADHIDATRTGRSARREAARLRREAAAIQATLA